MISRYYEIGRVAAFSAADAHDDRIDRIRSYDVMRAAYDVVKQFDELLVSMIPEWEDMTADQRTKYCIGYCDALKEIGQ